MSMPSEALNRLQAAFYDAHSMGSIASDIVSEAYTDRFSGSTEVDTAVKRQYDLLTFSVHHTFDLLERVLPLIEDVRKICREQSSYAALAADI